MVLEKALVFHFGICIRKRFGTHNPPQNVEFVLQKSGKMVSPDTSPATPTHQETSNTTQSLHPVDVVVDVVVDVDANDVSA